MVKSARGRKAAPVSGPGSAAGPDAIDDEAGSAGLAPAVGLGVTPSMAQYTEIKAANPDSLLFYRMGDFYELFFEDAVAASQALGITLTKRGKHLGEDIPMCGVPVHAADEYLQRLIRRGFRVAVCEQMEDPAEARKRGSKAVVRRDVVRLVTPGTLTEDSLLEAKRHNFLTALFAMPKSRDASAGMLALASLDISTGECQVGEVAHEELASELARLAPSEILVADSIIGDPILKQHATAAGIALTPVPRAYFDSVAGERDLKSRLGVSDIAGMGSFTRGELAATGAVLKYIELTQIGRRPMLRPPRRTGPQSVLVIDAATRANLEILRSASGDRQGGLLAAIDRTVTGPGGRELAARLASPLKDLDAIGQRLDATGYLVDQTGLRDRLRAQLREAPDMARAMARLAFGRGGPRDLGTIRTGVVVANHCCHMLDGAGRDLGLPVELAGISANLATRGLDLARQLADALVDEPPVNRRDGGFIRDGYRTDLDENRTLRDRSRQVLAELQQRYQDETGLKSLKIKHNNMLGYFLELPAAQGQTLRETHGDRFELRQSLVNAMRFSTKELADIEGRITAAAERALALEQEIFTELADEVAKIEPVLTAAAAALAELDHTAGLAELSASEGYCRPRLDDSLAFEIRAGRHPVVEQALRAGRAGVFIENDCVLGRPRPGVGKDLAVPGQTDGGASGFDDNADARIWLVTGPNMAGKSTFLRQNALIAIMAQMGSYVPAAFAHIGIVDRLFSRVGASDDLARGRSTFMVEMVETAGILNQATERSLVILDEIGRGTATFDGLSIAWATVEYLHEVNRCRALFATHYHELTALPARLPFISNATIEVKEWHDDIVFLHRVIPGAADRSYGIQVAKLAGLPRPVIVRAGEVLRLLEENDTRVTAEDLIEELPLFAAARPKGGSPAAPSAEPMPSPVDDMLAQINPDELTPKQALEALYRLKGAR